MFNFFYESLETLKLVKKPSQKEVMNMIMATFVIVLIAGIYFTLIDGFFSSFYLRIYNILKSSS